MVVVGKKECSPLFVHNVCFRQTPLTWLSKRENGRLHDLLRKFLLSVVSLYIRCATLGWRVVGDVWLLALTQVLLTTNILECSALAPIHIRDSVQVLMSYWYIVDLCTVYPRRAA